MNVFLAGNWRCSACKKIHLPINSRCHRCHRDRDQPVAGEHLPEHHHHPVRESRGVNKPSSETKDIASTSAGQDIGHRSALNRGRCHRGRASWSPGRSGGFPVRSAVDDLMESYEENHCTECGRSLEGGSGRTARQICDSCTDESR
jgi:hypothetical protein